MYGVAKQKALEGGTNPNTAIALVEHTLPYIAMFLEAALTSLGGRRNIPHTEILTIADICVERGMELDRRVWGALAATNEEREKDAFTADEDRASAPPGD